ncbi:unnamed protein product [Bursaphelenchus xylophilus]|uniref:(pine wood nematode) hypothetical protein n=1 Tax=Bursaphelenchus xylophilus TaxID=6326 RepID=A0A1I7RTQ4_BURXY|nr:unnamed protein product [Bursaphelenchus xylophilus]CAG9122219.1 unnamed protein product [Bursaphelenchus xylophilus]
MFTKDPMPPTTQWTRFRVGRVKRFTFSDLQPETRYICAVTAEHNAGLATMSKTLRFRTKTRSSLKNPQFDQEEDSIAVNMAVEQASHSPTPSLMWRPQPFFAQIQNALQTHFLSSPLRFRFLPDASSRDLVLNDTDDN